eukprot:Gb_24029 [translate_table: standard]
MVIWATFSQNHDIRKVQNDITKSLGLILPNESTVKDQGAVLCNRFKKKKIFLLILDDMWSSIDLLGVELVDGCCKIIVSIHTKRVMNAHHMLKMVPLTQEESWQLFYRRAFRNGKIVILTEEIRDIAHQIIGECQGFPLPLNDVATTMPNLNDQRAWGSILI